MNKNGNTLNDLQKRVIEFGEKRNWRQFHNPKNVAMALNVECGELLEIFQWLTLTEANNLNQQQHQNAASELADIMMYSLLLSHELNIDLEQAVKEKLAINEQRFPATN